MTATGPAISTVLPLLPDPTRLSSQARWSGRDWPNHRPSAGGERLACCFRRHQSRTALYDFIAPFFGRVSEVEDIVKSELSRLKAN